MNATMSNCVDASMMNNQKWQVSGTMRHSWADRHGRMTPCRRFLVLVPLVIAMGGITAPFPVSASTAAIHYDLKHNGDDRGRVTLKIGNGKRNELDLTLNSPNVTSGTQNIITGDGGSAIQVGKCVRRHRVCKLKQKIWLTSRQTRGRGSER